MVLHYFPHPHDFIILLVVYSPILPEKQIIINPSLNLFLSGVQSRLDNFEHYTINI